MCVFLLFCRFFFVFFFEGGKGRGRGSGGRVEGGGVLGALSIPRPRGAVRSFS